MVSKFFTLPAAVMAVTTMGASASSIDLSSLDGTIAVTQSVPELSMTAVNPGNGATAVGMNIAALTIDSMVEYTICAASGQTLSGPFTCANDFSIDFTTASTGVKITAADFLPDIVTSAVDTTVISAFDALNTLLGSVTVTSTDLFATTPDVNGTFSLDLDFSSFGAISSLSFDDQSTAPFVTGGLLFYGIEATAAAPVPLPASLPLLAMGAGVFGVMRRRQRKTA